MPFCDAPIFSLSCRTILRCDIIFVVMSSCHFAMCHYFRSRVVSFCDVTLFLSCHFALCHYFRCRVVPFCVVPLFSFSCRIILRCDIIFVVVSCHFEMCHLSRCHTTPFYLLLVASRHFIFVFVACRVTPFYFKMSSLSRHVICLVVAPRHFMSSLSRHSILF